MGSDSIETAEAFDKRAAQYSVTRIQSYNDANQRFPDARATERDLLVDLLELRPELTICDIAAGGGYLSDGIYSRLEGRCEIICIENSSHFIDSLPERYTRVLSSLGDLRLDDESVDRVTCLAGLHHQVNKECFFAEAFRILRPGGVIAIADVIADSPTATFLNDAITRWSDTPHDGHFLTAGALGQGLATAGFTHTRETSHEFTWNFVDIPALVWFCKTLFRMNEADLDSVERELRRYLQITTVDGTARLSWSLAYARGTKLVEA